MTRTLFWRADEQLKALGRNQHWIDFHRACGSEGLFFDDIKQVSRGYQATAFRVVRDRMEFSGRGTGAGPVEAVIAAYRDAIERGDAVSQGHDTILLAVDAVVEPPPADAGEIEATPTITIEDLIG